MKIKVDYELCTSNAVCMSIVPEIFDVREDGFLYLSTDEPNSAQWDQVRLAAESCPNRAISLED